MYTHKRAYARTEPSTALLWPHSLCHDRDIQLQLPENATVRLMPEEIVHSLTAMRVHREKEQTPKKNEVKIEAW
jgi:hypothetical protein